MLSFTGSLKIYVSVEPCDMRKGYEGLAGLVTMALQQDLRSGALFVFGNRRRTRLKILYFDGTGIWHLTKTHDSHCSHWKTLADTVSVPSAFRPRPRSVRCGGRAERHSIYQAAKQYNARHSGLDV